MMVRSGTGRLFGCWVAEASIVQGLKYSMLGCREESVAGSCFKNRFCFEVGRQYGHGDVHTTSSVSIFHMSHSLRTSRSPSGQEAKIEENRSTSATTVPLSVSTRQNKDKPHVLQPHQPSSTATQNRQTEESPINSPNLSNNSYNHYPSRSESRPSSSRARAVAG